MLQVIKHCECCGKEFMVKSSLIRVKCCSRQCSNTLRKSQVEKKCQQCGKLFKVIKQRENTALYCCRTCADLSKRAEVNAVCDFCGKTFHRKKSHLLNHSIGIFCSINCLNNAKKNAYKGKRNHQYGLKGALNASFAGEETLVHNHKVIDIMVYVPKHPYANRNGRVKKHRLLVEQNYHLFNSKYFETIDGTIVLKKNVDVHHKDKNHNNNAIENLIPCTKSEHRIYHSEDYNKTRIRDNKGRFITKTAVLKSGELLESHEDGNQQPSQPLTKLEGSETNS